MASTTEKLTYPGEWYESEDELMARFTAEFVDLSEKPPLPVVIDNVTLWYIVSSLQLALRHPDNTGTAARTVRDFIRQVQERIAPEGTALSVILARGFDPAFDVGKETRI